MENNNRIIKFRVWNNYQFIKNGREISWTLEDLIFNEMNSISDFSIQQFTGLLDKNNKEIYEGDIIKITSNSIKIGQVKYLNNNACFNVIVPNEDYSYSLDKVSCNNFYEVIGNISENPNLLK
jgi:uncharacterized phage protein (TIGR01671 family)